ncbi:hypothetical protein RJ55_07713 [Drechmeria coniospora]|nr:hypothetical protein RJ55_07713 [Drechmeria coniospora]
MAELEPSSHCYQTFPTRPPKTPLDSSLETRSGLVSSSSSPAADLSSSSSADDDDESCSHRPPPTPLPVRQLLLLAFLSLSEQTALNSISPYLPQMVTSMPGIPADRGGFYVGVVASAFALAQLSTNFLWGYASDLVGRKPVLVAGTTSLAACFCLFGLCTRYWQIVVLHVAMGLLNGNAACVPTVLGEVTDRSNQGRAFTYLPVIYSLGGIAGPALGGLLVGSAGGRYPYLGPNLLCAALLALSVVVVALGFEETLGDASGPEPWRPRWLGRLLHPFRSPSRAGRKGGAWAAPWPRSQQQPLLYHSSSSCASDSEDAGAEFGRPSKQSLDEPPAWRGLVNRRSLLLLATYLVFQLSNVSFNSLYPIFAASPAPVGRELDPDKIGLSLGLAGVATIVFQFFLYEPLKSRVGSLGTYRLALLGIAVSAVLMPWVGHLDDEPLFGVASGRLWLYAELGLVLMMKNICAVGGLSSVMLLITNSAASHASLGTLNGVAQTLSALGRSIGPVVSGGLFALSAHVRPKGEALAWSLFGGLALLGCVGALFIRSPGLESDDWDEDDEYGWRGDDAA